MKLQSKGMYGASIIWGTWVLVLTQVTLPGYFVTAITSFTGFAGLLAYVILTKNRASFRQVRKSPKLLRLTAIVAFLEAAQNALFMVAFMLAVSGGGTIFIPIIRSLGGVITPMIAAIAVRREFSVRYLLYGVIATIGAIFIFSWNGLDAGGRVSYLGLTFVGLSVIISAIQNISQRFLALEMTTAKQSATNVITYQSLMSGTFLLPLIIYYLITGAGTTPNLISQIAYISIFGLTHVALAFVLRLYALKHITAQQAVIIDYLQPVTSVTLSILFLNETFNIGYVIGSILILGVAIAAGLHQTQNRQKSNL